VEAAATGGEQLTGRRFLELWPDAVRRGLFAACLRVLEAGAQEDLPDHPWRLRENGRSRTGRADVRLTGAELVQRQLEIRYINRGGGAILHAPGQLAIYPIVPLQQHGWMIGEYLRRLQKTLADVLVEFNVKPATVPGSMALSGRSGVLAAVGVSVRQGVTMHGAFLNVNPEMRDFGRVAVAGGQTMSSLLSHRALPTKMSKVRAALVTHLAEALALERYHLHTGHPLLAELPDRSHARESAA
jgi:lipoyl(octanoyl) transferase